MQKLIQNSTSMKRPERWSEPFDVDMTESIVDQLLTVEPFSQMDPSAFSGNIPLRGVLLNDCRTVDLEKGDIIVREGDYGHSAFFILSGEAIVSLKSLPANILGRVDTKKRGWIRSIAQLWTNSKFAETRDYSPETKGEVSEETGSREDADGTHIFLHDIPRVIKAEDSAIMKPGEIFGEISALTRTARSATVVANSKMRLLEIRWQGFRELLKRHTSMRKHIEQQYRDNSLRSHLREISIFKGLPPSTIEELAAATIFETYGNFEWSQKFQSTRQKDIAERIHSEPLIAEQGEYVNGLILIRNGFARLSRKHGDGHQTIAYLGKGETFGFREIAHNWKSEDQTPWMLGLRAVGYVDALRIPTDIVERLVLPFLKSDKLPMPLTPPNQAGKNRRTQKRKESMDVGLLEFLVENRFINGTQTMMIDLDRCTRCDDCVRACAATHDNNPRFIRHGQKYDHWMIANACMHCLDPVCMIGCPTGAIGRDLESGNVTINDTTCIGCSTCANSCPYDNIRMVEIRDRAGRPLVDEQKALPIIKATKCDLCADQSGGPACQRACPHDALVRIDLTSPDEINAWSKR
jgi:Fe-S-cluster-containing dehydrogenase component/CRP-like cAMP-binding protein